MKRTARAGILVLLSAAGAFSLFLYRTLQLGRADAQPVFLEILNPRGEFRGPEGIQFDGAGNLFVGDVTGKIWELEQGGSPKLYTDLSSVPQDSSDSKSMPEIQVGGMAFDGDGNLYLAAFGFAQGSVLRVDAETREVHIFARGIGIANYLVMTSDSTHLWVSDYRREGRLLRYRVGSPLPARPDLVVTGLEHPNGLALGRDEKLLFAAETYSGNVARVDLNSETPRIDRIINLKGAFATGSLDGLAFDPRDANRRFLYVAENIRGMFSVLDLDTAPVAVVKRLRLTLMGGRPCPASMVIREGYLYFTDLWSCSPIRILLGMPDFRRHAYRFRVSDLTLLASDPR